jgi:hypothetical protein
MAYTKAGLRERIKREVMAGDKGGKPGQWSARKAQLVAQRYEAAGGGYTGGKSEKQESLSKWTKEEWRTKSGKPSTQGKKATGERYLPKMAIEKLSDEEYEATSRKKREGMRKGKQFVPNTPAAADARRAASGKSSISKKKLPKVN